MKNNTEARGTPELVDVHVYSYINGDLHFMVMRRSSEVLYAGEWRIVAGKLKKGEIAKEGALREFIEETGLEPLRFWCVPDINSFFDFKQNKTHHIPVFAVETKSGAVPVLNHEHADWRWLPVSEATEKVYWPAQKRGMHLISSLLQNPQVSLSEAWLIPITS